MGQISLTVASQRLRSRKCSYDRFKGKVYDYKIKSCSVDRRVIEKGTERKRVLVKEIEQTDRLLGVSWMAGVVEVARGTTRAILGLSGLSI